MCTCCTQTTCSPARNCKPRKWKNVKYFLSAHRTAQALVCGRNKPLPPHWYQQNSFFVFLSVFLSIHFIFIPSLVSANYSPFYRSLCIFCLSLFILSSSIMDASLHPSVLKTMFACDCLFVFLSSFSVRSFVRPLRHTLSHGSPMCRF